MSFIDTDPDRDDVCNADEDAVSDACYYGWCDECRRRSCTHDCHLPDPDDDPAGDFWPCCGEDDCACGGSRLVVDAIIVGGFL